MIKLKIKKSKNLDLIGDWDFEKNEIRIGNHRQKINDIRLLENIRSNLTLMTHDQFLLLDIKCDEPNLYEVYVNDKITIGRYFLKVGDRLTIGPTEIEIIDYKVSESFVSDEFNENLTKIVRGNHPINHILSLIEDDLKEL